PTLAVSPLGHPSRALSLQQDRACYEYTHKRKMDSEDSCTPSSQRLLYLHWGKSRCTSCKSSTSDGNTTCEIEVPMKRFTSVLLVVCAFGLAESSAQAQFRYNPYAGYAQAQMMQQNWYAQQLMATQQAQ